MAITIPILTDFNGSGIDRGIAQFQKLEGTGAKAGFLLRKAALPAAAALGAIAVGGKLAVSAAADLGETLSKTDVLFGNTSETIKTWSKTTATAFGISRQEALDAATTFATFGKAAGLTGQDLSKFSTDFTGLAGDLASFNNTTPEQAIQAIGSALRGESEPLRQYGVLLDDASMRQAAVRLGLIKTTKEALTPQNKVLAAQALIYEQTKDAQGDFARTSDSVANRGKILKARMDDLTASLGTALLPIVGAVTGLLVKFAGWVDKNQGLAKVLIGTVAGLSAGILILNGILKASAVVMATVRAAQLALNLVMAANPIGLVITALALFVGGLIVAYRSSETFRGIVDKVFDAVKKVVDFLKPIGSGAFEGLKLAFDAIKTVLSGYASLVTGVFDAFKAVYNFLKPIAAGVFNGIKTAFALLDTPIALVKTALSGVSTVAEPIINFLSKVKSGVFSAVSNAFRLLSVPVSAFATALRKAQELWDWFTSIGGGKNTPTVAIGPTTPGTGLPPGYRSNSLNAVPMGIGGASIASRSIVVNVSAGLVSTPDQVGQQIIESIQIAQRRSGTVFAAA